MAFTDLSSEVQTLMLQDYSQFAKWFVFLALVVLSIYYLTIVWPNQKKTRFMMVFLFRILAVSFSFVYLIAIPLTIISMSPEYSFYSFYTVPLSIWGVLVAIGVIMFFVDLVRYGFFVLLKLGGLDVQDKNVNKIVSQMKQNKHMVEYLGRR